MQNTYGHQAQVQDGRADQIALAKRKARLRKSLNNSTKAAKDLRFWQIWRSIYSDEEILTWGRSRPTLFDDTNLLFEFRSENWLTAEWVAFGRRPPIDRNIQELVALINALPGVQTTGCCQGHPRRGDTHAFVGLHFDSLSALDSFVVAVSRTTLGRVAADLVLSCGSHRRSHENVPVKALAFMMYLLVEKRRGHRAPRRRELAEFTDRLRHAADELGLLIPPGVSDFQRTSLLAVRALKRPWKRAQK